MVDRRTLAVAAALASLTMTQGAANAEVRRERTLRRPYVVEIGQPYPISTATLDNESDRTQEMKGYLADYGYPDYAEIQEISPEWPWESYEVRLFYLRRNVEVDFGHVVAIEDPSPDFGVMKFQGGIPAQKRHEIEIALQARQAPPAMESAAAPATTSSPDAKMETLVARVEAAAERASQAADQAAEQSEAAERAANRTANIVEKMTQGTHPKTKKH